LDLKDIKELIALMRRNDLSEFEMEREGFRIKLKKGSEPMISGPMAYAPMPYPGMQAPPAPAPAAAAPAAPAPVEKPGHEITSPMVGTYYSAASPEASAYVEVGTEVTEDTVVCIIEAMKVMNEIKAEKEGEVVSVLIENGESVEFGQPLVTIRRTGTAR
jgi:acetyl-CoA carboxylase biotin carboxyl carrier protein